jgi:hypothetical protein
MSNDGARHPRDGQGRILPAASWPPERAAPGDLELVRRFCNSVNRENGADRFATARGFDAWLLIEGLPATRPNRDALAKIVAFREALQMITVANQQKRRPAHAWAELADVVSRSRSTSAPATGSISSRCRRRGPWRSSATSRSSASAPTPRGRCGDSSRARTASGRSMTPQRIKAAGGARPTRAVGDTTPAPTDNEGTAEATVGPPATLRRAADQAVVAHRGGA